jgi:hypothetical protein
LVVLFCINNSSINFGTGGKKAPNEIIHSGQK